MSASDPREDRTILAGIVGDSLRSVTRPIPAGEPPELPPNAELRVIGKRVNRVDAVPKVTGQARYTYDVQLPGMLYGRIVSSTVPHARIKSIDTSAAEAYPGVRAVHILDRVLSIAQLRDPSVEANERYPLVRYHGQPIAAVAAVSMRAAKAAAKLVRIEYERLPHVTSLEAAMQEDAPVVFPGATEQAATAGGGGAAPNLPQEGNLRGPARGGLGGGPRGDVQQGFAQAEHILTREYSTQVQTHAPMETHGLVADWRDEELTLYASTQFVLSVRDEAADVFGLPKDKIRVISEFTGGGFGAKFGIGNYGALAIHLSRKARAPVRLMLDRREEHVSVGNRPSTIQRLKLGAKLDGTLTALQVESFGTGGVALGAGVGFCHSTMYPIPNVLTEHYDVLTDAGPSAAFRAPGQVQGIFALEQALDELAHTLGMDPLALRDKVDTNDADDARARKVERRIGAEHAGWAQRRPPAADPGPIKRGLGMAQSQWAYIVHGTTSCEVRIRGDGSVAVITGAQDIGTGTRTIMAQTVAEELGLRTEDIDARIGDSRYPAGPAAGGSRVTSSITPAARNASYAAARDLAARIAPHLGAKPEEIVFQDSRVFARGQPDRGLSFVDAVRAANFDEIVHRADRREDYDGYRAKLGDLHISKQAIGGVQFAQIAVDTETGVVKVERVVAVHDCGRPINPKLIESQIYGGVIQGVSYALYEERHLDPDTGVQLNANIDQYKIVGSRETPDIEVHVIEQLGRQSSTDARGVAEPANVATAAAIANAFYNATGKRIRTLPMTPANVLAALRADDRNDDEEHA
ncbi:MAG TPA: xanthine dehydrogenase family protein molybdopterin-binding subunit [Steroidobacteraceae bacterium]|nr:xanthine dehydrogenase family protein molybdopterin-binding subunit [Steroidobacteraceae bacterium]